jgi:hypothetical protein
MELWRLQGLFGVLPPRVRNQPPFSESGHPLAFAWLYWLRYGELRFWHPLELIDETCAAFEAKHMESQTRPMLR